MKKVNGKNLILVSVLAIIFTNNIVYAESCKGLLTQEAADFIKEIINYVRILVPVVLILLCAGDLVTAVLAQDEKKMAPAYGRIVKRCIAAVAVFFVPLIIELILGLDGIKDSLNLVDDPLCGVTDGTTSDSTTEEGSDG